VNQAYQQQALAEVRTEYANYFEAIEQHPRSLIGTEVPSINKEGTEVLQDAEDAREWQDAVKHLLVADVRGRASRAMDEQADFIDTIHSSIDLFRNNRDLIPGTKDFNVDLANRFATMAQPYELRVDGKLHGYSIPVQPLIDQLRAQAAAKPAAGAASTPAPAATTPPAAAPTPDPGQPQAGISSKAGAGTETEDFSTLFGTIGLPNLQI
jgi:hypothetical protein